MSLLKEKKIFLPDIGEVSIKKKVGVKRMSITLRPHRGITVTLPYWARFDEGEHFLLSKSDWLKKSVSKIKKLEARKPNIIEQREIETLGRTLLIRPQFIQTVKTIVNTETIVVEYPVELDISEPALKSKIELAVKKALINEAKEILPVIVNNLAIKHGFTYKSVRIGSPRTRWGSCSFTNNINLSYRLICIPRDICEYVVIHELTHTIHKNHSDRFWNSMTNYLPQARILDKHLKKYSLL